jgi:hypothetical protein
MTSEIAKATECILFDFGRKSFSVLPELFIGSPFSLHLDFIEHEALLARGEACSTR